MIKTLQISLCAFLILFTVSGCSQNIKPAPDIKIPDGAAHSKPEENKNEELTEQTKKNGAAEMPVLAVYDEKDSGMHRGELFCKSGDTFIYAGEQGNIYMVNTKTDENKLLTVCERPQKLYFDGKYVYYMPYYQMAHGIYRVSLEGSVEKISENSSIQLWLTDDKIYFTDQAGYDGINGTPQGNLCSMDKDGGNGKVLIKNVKNYFYIQDNWIYYTDLKSRSLYRADLSGGDQKLLSKGRTYICTFADGYGIYVDYDADETFHLYNVQTGEDAILGQFGVCQRLNGETYVQTREKGADGTPSMTDWSVLQLNKETGKMEKRVSLKLSDTGIDMMQYVYNGWVYFYSTGHDQHGSGTYRVEMDLNTNVTEFLDDHYLYYLDGCGYYIEQDENYKQIGFSRIDLKTGQAISWPLQ